jgi:hypothetical protein
MILKHLKFVRPILEIYRVMNQAFDKKSVSTSTQSAIWGFDVLLRRRTLRAACLDCCSIDEKRYRNFYYRVYKLNKQIKKKQIKSAIVAPADLAGT